MTLRDVPRQPRLDLPGQFYHLIVRGIDRRAIFRADGDRADFLRRLGQGLLKTGSLCLTWALMTNHVHLLIVSGVRGVAALMHPLLTGYVGAFNRKYRRIGHLVQNRFKSILCEEDPYLLELIRYIPLNPARAGIVKTMEDLARYPWTGHSAILGLTPRPWQASEEVLGRFGSQAATARPAYASFVADAWNQGHRDDLEGGGLFRSRGGIRRALESRTAQDPQAFDARILGSGQFVERILREADQTDERRRAISRSGLTLAALQKFAAELTGVDADSILQRDRTRLVADARALFVYTASEFLGHRLKDLATLLGLQSGSTSQARQRGQRLAEKYPMAERLSGYLAAPSSETK